MKLKSYSLSIISTLVLSLIFIGCQPKKPKADADQSAAAATNAAPQIDDSAKMEFGTGSDSGKIDGLRTVHFPYDKSSLSAETKKQIQGNVEWMKAHANVNLQIEGHCDQKGSAEYNLALGERRAKAVSAYMESMGVAKKRLNIISYGKEKPIATGDSEDAMAKNRRANFLPLNQ